MDDQRRRLERDGGDERPEGQLRTGQVGVDGDRGPCELSQREVRRFGRNHLYRRVPLLNWMNFWKNSKRPLTPSPPSFLENHVAIFFVMDMVAYMQGGMRAR